MADPIHRWAVVNAGRAIAKHAWVLADVLGIYQDEGEAQEALERHKAAACAVDLVYVVIDPAGQYVQVVSRR